MDGNHTLQLHLFDPSNKGAFQIPFIINLILGLPSNIGVLWLILAGPGDKAAEMFSLNQTICEIAICVSNVIFLIVINIAEMHLQNTVQFISGFLFTGRPIFMSCICVERYVAVVHPVVFLRSKPLRYRAAGAGIAWLVVLVFCVTIMLLPLFAVNFVCLGVLIVCFVVQLFCCAEILRVLRRGGPGEEGREREGMNSMKLKALKIIVINMVSTAIIYLPFVIVIALYRYMPDKHIYLACIINYINMVAGFIPPLLYMHRAGKLPCIRGP